MKEQSEKTHPQQHATDTKKAQPGVSIRSDIKAGLALSGKIEDYVS